jgi:hypothetical protein
MHTRPIRFFHRGRVVEVADAAPTRSVLDWLREDARCTGTKEGCNEGDCGACTVVIGTLAAPGDKQAVRGLSLQTVNAASSSCPRWTARRCSRRGREGHRRASRCTRCSRRWSSATARSAASARRAS